MQKIAKAMFASLVLSCFSGTILLAQEASEYPWRATNDALIAQQTATQLDSTASQNQPFWTGKSALDLIPSSNTVDPSVPRAPSMRLNALLSKVRSKFQDEPQPSLSDAAVQEVPEPVAVEQYQPSVVSPQEPMLIVPENTPGEVDYCNRDCGKKCELGCIKRVFGQGPRGLEMGGWASVGYHNRETILFNDRSGQLAPHQIWLYAENAADRCGSWDLGYRVDTFYGLDAQNTQAFGNEPTGAPEDWDNSWDNGAFGWAMPQAYFQLANSIWDVKLGKFFTPHGNERIQAPENFFYSRTYTAVLSQPYTLTGVLGERQVNSRTSILIGGAFGWDTGYDQNGDGKVFLAGFRHRPNSCVEIAWASSYGETGYRGNGVTNSTTLNAQLTPKTRWAFRGNWLDLDDNQEFGFVNSLFRDVNCCLSLGARLEWWRSDRFSADQQSTNAFTMGANYRHSANLLFRPEVRWDWGRQAVDNGEAIIGFDAILHY